jgi:hypothetical protein
MKFTPNVAAGRLEERKKYLELVKKYPFFNWLLQNPKEVTINVGGSNKRFQIMRNGLRFTFPGDKVAREIVTTLDPWGRKMLFYKSSGQSSTMPGQWFPFHSIALYQEGRKKKLGLLKTEHHATIIARQPVPEPLQTLLHTINQMHNSGEIKYRETNDIYFIHAINAWL